MLTGQTISIDMAKPGLDVGVIASDVEKSRAFYGGVLGLKAVQSLPMPDGSTMFRYQTGTSVLKLRGNEKAPKYAGAVRDAVGFRLLTIFIEDFDAAIHRLKESGATVPKVLTAGKNGAKIAFVADPDSNRIELVGLSGAASLDRLAVGLTVSDIEKSRAFYGKVLGLKEEAPRAVEMMNGVKEYRFLAGTSVIKFWTGAGENLPKHTGNISDAVGFRYFTFMVKDVDVTFESLQAAGAKIVVAPVNFGKLARIMMVADPDGNWVEFASVPAKPAKSE